MPQNNPHIFYTDDDEDDREFFRNALAEVNHDLVLTTTSDGVELLEALDAPPPVPKMIFLDLNMPRLNGFDALRQIRAQESIRHFPVIIFTTVDNQQTADTARRLGANMYVAKPNSFEGLKDVIAACLNRDWTAIDVRSNFEWLNLAL